MSRGVCFLVAAALLVPHWASAQMQPHRAQYVLRLGTAANAPRIGTAVQDITLDCAGWHIKRDISTEIAITSSWKLSLASKLAGEEARDGGGFRYRMVQIQNGDERDTRGKIERSKGQLRADIVTPAGPTHFVLPPQTLMPVAAIGHLVDRLRAKASAFPALMFDAEVLGDAFLVDVTALDPGTLRPAAPAEKPVAVPASHSWPVFMSFTRGREQDQKPLFSVSAKIYDNGVLDRLTVDTGLLKVGADLQDLQMHKAPTCPGS
ncbi:EipB family protein [Reyranella sp.]|uniref:EipB family protein n=1 Tax=Reyranella sp. TaxID=1929291 RepID=UPI002F932752